MLGGGNFTIENKIMPGSYINFISTDKGVNVFGERGVAALAAPLNYGSNGIIELTKDVFINKSRELLGYNYNDKNLTNIREVFKNAKKLYLFKLNNVGHTQATCAYCTAVKYGSRGNDFIIRVNPNVDNKSYKDVTLYLDDEPIFDQTVYRASDLKANEYVTWNTSSSLENTNGTHLTGGTDGNIEGSSVTTFLSTLQRYSFNAVGIVYDDGDYEDVLIEYTKRMRDEIGKKFQCVTSSNSGDYEGNICIDTDVRGYDTCNLIPWVVGAVSACPINRSLTNSVYNGEYIVGNDYTIADLENCIKGGFFTFHKVNDETRVLLDINSLTTTTSEKGDDFKDNQTVKVCDQIAMDIAEIFNNYYLGKVPNDTAGRISLWNDIVKHHQRLKDMRAIEDFDENNIKVSMGENKKSVVITDCITPVNAMAQLYMTVTIN